MAITIYAVSQYIMSTHCTQIINIAKYSIIAALGLSGTRKVWHFIPDIEITTTVPDLTEGVPSRR